MAIIGQGRVGIRSIAAPSASTLWNNLVSYYTGDNTPNDAKGTYNGTLVNGATYATGKINNGFSFDGINDYVSMGNVLDIGLDSWSYNFWFKADTLATYVGLVTKGSPSNNYPRWWIISEINKLSFAFQSDYTNESRYVFKSTTSITTGVWTMCTVVVNRLGSVKLFLNGIEEIVVSVNGNGTAIANDMTPMSAINLVVPYPFVVGDMGAGGIPFDGIIDEVGVWKNKLLTATEVTELYNAGNGKQYPN